VGKTIPEQQLFVVVVELSVRLQYLELLALGLE